MKTIYRKLVSQAKSHVKDMQGYQQKISILAVEACTIRHGGRSSKYYTLKNFANDIGLGVSSLQNWVNVYRNVIQKLASKDQRATSEVWKNANKVSRVVSEINRSSNKLNGTPGKISSIKTNKEIRILYEKVKIGNDFFVKWRNLIASQRHLKYCMKNLDMGEVENSQWIELLSLLDSNSDVINGYLKNKIKEME